LSTQARHAHTPATAQEAAQLLRGYAARGIGVRIAGAGTKPWGGAGAECGVELRTAALDAIVEHNTGDLTAVLQPGAPLRELTEAFAAAGQMLALDPPLGDGGAATIGGAVATGDSGPLRHRYGAARDLVLGITVALPDGSLARAGGKVIKNVAGYDLAKLFSGSFGTLGLITEVAVRLHPRAPAHATATARTDDPGLLQRAAIALACSSLEAQCLDVRWEARTGTVLARFAGVAAAAQAQAAERLLAETGVGSAAVTEDDEELWSRQREAQRSTEGGAVVRVSGRPTGLADACVAAQVAGATLVGRAALGVSWIALPAAAPGELVTAIARLRTVLAPSPCVVLDAPPYVRAHLDPWDHPEDGALVLMRRVKERFDPARTCNPGIFVGGI
jgi:glycolate oxidase FAD binding subunit